MDSSAVLASFSNDSTRNPVKWGAFALCVLLLLLAVNLPVFSAALQVKAFWFDGWMLTMAMSATPVLFGGLGDFIYRRVVLKKS